MNETETKELMSNLASELGRAQDLEKEAKEIRKNIGEAKEQAISYFGDGDTRTYELDGVGKLSLRMTAGRWSTVYTDEQKSELKSLETKFQQDLQNEGVEPAATNTLLFTRAKEAVEN